MIKVKLQKRQGLRNKYFTYVITLPKSIIEAMQLQEAKYIELILEKGKIILKPI